MKASFVALRKKSGESIKALKRKERVTVHYRGRPAAVMQPIDGTADKAVGKTKDHAAFGMWAGREDMKDVAASVPLAPNQPLQLTSDARKS